MKCVGAPIYAGAGPARTDALHQITVAGPSTLGRCLGNLLGNANLLCSEIAIYRRTEPRWPNIKKIEKKEPTWLNLKASMINDLDEFIVPGWFINAPVALSSPPERPFNVPLNITNVKKGDYLVHRDHGVGICMGLYKYNGDGGFGVLKPPCILSYSLVKHVELLVPSYYIVYLF